MKSLERVFKGKPLLVLAGFCFCMLYSVKIMYATFLPGMIPSGLLVFLVSPQINLSVLVDIIMKIYYCSFDVLVSYVILSLKLK